MTKAINDDIEISSLQIKSAVINENTAAEDTKGVTMLYLPCFNALVK